MPSPIVTFVNSTQVDVNWGVQNFHKGGPILRYELRICSQRTEACHEFHYPAEYSRADLILDQVKNDLAPNCYNESVTNFFNFTVRSVTFKNEDETFFSEWSPEEIVPAYCEGESHNPHNLSLI